MSETRPPLEGIRVLDLSDEFGAYGGRLLAGLGAEVTRVAQHRMPVIPPRVEGPKGEVSLFEEWVHAGKTIVAADPEDDPAALERLVASVDVLLDSADGRGPGAWANVNPQLVHVVVTPFGWGFNPRWGPVDDLIVLGEGGLLDLGGYDDGPVAAFGGQSYLAAGTFAAVAALVGLIERAATGFGTTADVSAQEAVAQALEDSLPTFALTGKLKLAQGDAAREAGTGIYACADGYVSMVAGRLGTAKAWAALVQWLSEEHEAGRELTDERWFQFSYRQTDEAIHRFREIFEEFASTRTKQSLYVEAQRRGIALSPVSDVSDLLENEQLAWRGFFYEAHHERLGAMVSLPGPPFRLSRSTQPRLGEAKVIPGELGDLVATLAGSSPEGPTNT